MTDFGQAIYLTQQAAGNRPTEIELAIVKLKYLPVSLTHVVSLLGTVFVRLKSRPLRLDSNPRLLENPAKPPKASYGKMTQRD
jgi:hypothetical protein